MMQFAGKYLAIWLQWDTFRFSVAAAVAPQAFHQVPDELLVLGGQGLEISSELVGQALGKGARNVIFGAGLTDGLCIASACAFNQAAEDGHKALTHLIAQSAQEADCLAFLIRELHSVIWAGKQAGNGKYACGRQIECTRYASTHIPARYSFATDYHRD